MECTVSAEHVNRINKTRRVLLEDGEPPFISHEWEEFVERLLESENPNLRQIGQLESEFLKIRQTSFNK
jgi:hypothetical protein